ncbi:MAG: SDR family oxidoreductase, partial [Acidimicrobiia bacterium]|nr:SDR family oxidoreductase [Acidimicrobiia bacterium]
MADPYGTGPVPRRSMLVTGAARGLGASIASHAAERGYRVAAVDLEFPSGDHDRPGITAYRASVNDEIAVADVLDDFGTPDVTVNNAGIVRFGPLVDQSVDDFRAVVDVNLVGCFVVAAAVARRLIDGMQPGSIINITSMNGVAAGPNAGAYGASKAGIAMLTAQMALEWGGHGIRVNAVAPGLIDAGMSEPIYADPSTRSARESKVPLGRLGTAADI